MSSSHRSSLPAALVAWALLAAVLVSCTARPPAVPVTGPGDPEPDDDVVPGVPEILRPAELLEHYLSAPGLEARRVLDELAGRDDAVGYTAVLHLARHHADVPQAVDLYRRALDLLPTAEVTAELVSVLESWDDFDGSGGDLAALLPWGSDVTGILRLGADPGPVLLRLEHERAWQKILDAVDEGHAPGLEQGRSYLRALAATGAYADALPGLARYWADHPDDDIMGWWYARALEGTGRLAEAASVYAQAGAIGHYRRGMVLERLGRPAEAISAYAASPHPEARWRAARMLEEAGRVDEALAVYGGLAREGAAASGDAAYRAYVLLSDAGDPGAGDYLELAAAHPAWMDRLGLPPRWPLEMALMPPRPPFLDRADAYRETGRPELAELEIAIGSRAAGGLDALSLGEWYLEQGDYFSAVRIGIPALDTRPCPRAYRLSYPLAFHPLVVEIAADYDVDPFLLLAVMREESHFRPDAVSWAGAMGLMQIMPATGRDIAAGMGMRFQVSDLLTPEVSIRFGASFLSTMLRSFGGDLDRALAAYNGGPANVRRWIATPLGGDPRSFPTAVPFVETRHYITKVRHSYLTYRWLYGGE